MALCIAGSPIQMNDPIFLTLDEVTFIHQNQIEIFGGDTEIRNIDLLISSLAQPQIQFGGEFLHRNLYEMGAAYLFHIVQNHPFVDGNKRTGSAVAYGFLRLNGLQITATPDEFGDLIMSVAKGETEKTKVTEFLRANTRKVL